MRIKKISPTTPANGNIENQYGTSQTNAYSEEYVNTTFATKGEIPTKTSDLTNDSNFATTDVATTSTNGLMSASDKTKLDTSLAVKDNISYSSNWNSITEPGYYLYNAWTGSGGSNRPTDTKCMGFVIVLAHPGGSHIQQIFFPSSTTITPAYRWYSGSAWDNWKNF